MTTYPLVQFVTAPTTGATVRLDLNTDVGSAKVATNADDFSLGAPTFSGEPGGVGGVYGYRQLTITPRITGTKANALALLTLLAREQGRASNWVHFKLDASTASRWFYVYRSAPQPLSLSEVDVTARNPDAWTTTLTLEAEAFAYEERVTLGPYTVTQTPDGTHPMEVVLPAIDGDAPTSLRVTIAPPTPGNAVGVNSAWMIGCASGTTSMTGPIVDIGTGDPFLNDTGTAAPTTDSTYFGGSYCRVTIGAATPNLINRIYGSLGALPIGRYKVMLRCAYNAGAAKTLLFRIQQWLNGQSGTTAAGPVVSYPVLASDTGRRFWVDLGEFSVPFGSVPPADGGGNSPGLYVGLEIGTADGSSATLDIDAFRLIPISGPQVSSSTLLRHSSYYGIASLGVGTFDGDQGQFWQWFNSGGTTYLEDHTSLQGSFPSADPAADKNVLLVMALDSGEGSVSGASLISTTGQQANVTVSYYPRKLHL